MRIENLFDGFSCGQLLENGLLGYTDSGDDGLAHHHMRIGNDYLQKTCIAREPTDQPTAIPNAGAGADRAAHDISMVGLLWVSWLKVRRQSQRFARLNEQAVLTHEIAEHGVADHMVALSREVHAIVLRHPGQHPL